MSRRNSRFSKETRREQRAAQKERAAFIHELSRQLAEDKLPNRKQKRERPY